MAADDYDMHTKWISSNRLSKLSIGQKTKLSELCKSLEGNTNRSSEVEELYEQFTGDLLEPSIARVWIHNLKW